MNDVKHNDDSIFPVHQHNPASLTQDEVADILRLADSYGLFDKAQMKLLVLFRNKKRAAYVKKRNKP